MLEAFIDAQQRSNGLTVFPIIAPRGPVLPYLLSTEVEGTGALTIRERGEEMAPMLLARNNSLHALLILGGEPLPGGSAGRLVERSFLLAGKHITQIPPSSIERGGWVSPDREAEITDWLESFPLHHQQVGSLAFHGGRSLGLEVMGSGNLYSPLHRRILIRFMKEALANPVQDDKSLGDPEPEAQRIVEAVENADRVATKRVGLGTYWSLSGPVFGGELIHDGNLVHLSVHPAPVEAVAAVEEGGGTQCS